MTRLGEALKRLADALLRIRARPPREVEEAIARDGLPPEEIAAYHERQRRGETDAPPDAPHIPEDGI